MQTATIFNHETVTLDGESFEDCEFRECRLVYSGGEPPHFRDCRTLAHLKLVWASGGKAPVQALIKEITGSGGR